MNNKIVKNKYNDDFIVEWIDDNFNTMELMQVSENQYKIITNINKYSIYITQDINGLFVDLFYGEYGQSTSHWNNLHDLRGFLEDVSGIPNSITKRIKFNNKEKK